MDLTSDSPPPYRPPPIDFADLESAIRLGCEEITRAGDTPEIDATDLGESKTAAICALMEWKRFASSRRRPLRIKNIPPRLLQLIAVYQLEIFF